MTPPRAAGFSLVELLVSVALFAIASGLAYGGLDALVRTRADLQQRSEQLQALQFAVGLLERDVRAALDRPVRDEYGAAQPALLLEPTRLELSRGGHANALAAPRAEIERVGYQLDDGTLQRLRHAVLDRTPGSLPAVEPLLAEVERFALAAWDEGGREHARWPPRGQTGLPRAIELRLRVAGIGDVRRLLELPAATP